MIPAKVYRFKNGDYVVTAVGPAPQHRPSRHMAITKRGPREWVLSVGLDLNTEDSTHKSLRAARIRASEIGSSS